LDLGQVTNAGHARGASRSVMSAERRSLTGAVRVVYCITS